MKPIHPIFKLLCVVSMTLAITSCSDMLDKDSDIVMYADKPHLNEATDTIYSMVGIQNKIQALADRTIILGEVRGDLVEVNNYGSSDLRDVALFHVDDNNRYNNPRDYYAVINNCNYFLEYADTALRNNRNEKVFLKEYAAVKAYRAWTYFQLALIYGQVPFVTEPLLDMNVDESRYPKYDLQQICAYFIQDLAPYADMPLPGYGNIGNVDSRVTYFPINVLLGELNLWSGNYREAALCYYRYISSRNGTRTAWPLGVSRNEWTRDDGKYERYSDSWSDNMFNDERFTSDGELITMTPGDSIPSSANFSSLPSLFNTTSLNDGYYALVPSPAMIHLSESQMYCNRTTTGDVGYAPTNLTDNRTGDLRLSSVWKTYNYNYGGIVTTTAGRPVTQLLSKYSTTHVHIWRRAMVYLHLAEAVNRAGLPRFAYHILATGVNNNVISQLQHEYPNDSTWLAQFDFPNVDYVLRTESPSLFTTIGVHSRGCGFTEYNQYYAMPDGTLEEQIMAVENMIVDEEALELAFEGQRFYDLMRVSLRRNDPSYLASRVLSRHGNTGGGGIDVNLHDTQTWYLRWNNRVGY
ncbi:MAG: RagB/SusD family nutrient uptake outer membrane protein [Prevotella sp.]|nr:RagB/SusD family nutrient uptake outer membrane protein [Prevotella sp.]